MNLLLLLCAIALAYSFHDRRREAKRRAVLDLYESGEISARHARNLLGMSRVEFIDFAADNGVSTLGYGAAELRAELDALAPRGDEGGAAEPRR